MITRTVHLPVHGIHCREALGVHVDSDEGVLVDGYVLSDSFWLRMLSLQHTIAYTHWNYLWCCAEGLHAQLLLSVCMKQHSLCCIYATACYLDCQSQLGPDHIKTKSSANALTQSRLMAGCLSCMA